MTDNPPIPDGSVIISPNQMYAQLGALERAVRDLQGAVDPAVADIRHDLGDHEARIRLLEQARHVNPAVVFWALTIGVAALGVLVTILTTR